MRPLWLARRQARSTDEDFLAAYDADAAGTPIVAGLFPAALIHVVAAIGDASPAGRDALDAELHPL